MQVAQVVDGGAEADDAGDRQAAAAGADARRVERCNWLAPSWLASAVNTTCRAAATKGSGGALVRFGVAGKQRVGQLFQLRVVGSGEGCERVPARHPGRRGRAWSPLAQDVAPDGRVRPATGVERRHAVAARLGERRGIGQRQFGQRLQRVVLGAGQLAEEDAASRRGCGRRRELAKRSARSAKRLALTGNRKDAASSAGGWKSIGWVCMRTQEKRGRRDDLCGAP